MLNEELRAGEKVLCGLIEHEAQRAHINAVPCSFASVEEFHVAVLIEPELQSLRGVVDVCRHNGEGHLQFVGKLLINVEERSTLGETLGDVVVLTANLEHNRKMEPSPTPPKGGEPRKDVLSYWFVIIIIKYQLSAQRADVLSQQSGGRTLNYSG